MSLSRIVDQQAVADREELIRAILERQDAGEVAQRHREFLEEVEPADDIDIEQVDVREEWSGGDPRRIEHVG